MSQLAVTYNHVVDNVSVVEAQFWRVFQTTVFATDVICSNEDVSGEVGFVGSVSGASMSIVRGSAEATSTKSGID